MRTAITPHSVTLWLSAADTSEWARRPGSAWPCSQLAGTRIFAQFDRNGLVDFLIDGRAGDCDVNEFNAITSDLLAAKIPDGHPCRFVVVDQFRLRPGAAAA